VVLALQQGGNPDRRWVRGSGKGSVHNRRLPPELKAVVGVRQFSG